jgi:hypothetical protein
MKKDRRSIIFFWSSTSAVTVRQSLTQAAISAWISRCGAALALSARAATAALPNFVHLNDVGHGLYLAGLHDVAGDGNAGDDQAEQRHHAHCAARLIYEP